MPRLHGAPAYARPVAVTAPTARPFDPDDLPLVLAMTEEERARIEAEARPSPAPQAVDQAPNLVPRPFSLRALTDRLRNARG